MKPLEQLDDVQLLEAALEEFQRATELPVVFGGYEADGATMVTALLGNRTDSLRGLLVEEGRGLGGKAMVEARPRFTVDYGRSQNITHDYDREVIGEGIKSLVAVPVLVGNSVRVVLYGGSYQQTTLASIMQKPLSEITSVLSEEVRVRDEVDRRTGPISTIPQRDLPAEQLEELRESYAEMRSIADSITSPALRARLEALQQRLARLSGAAPPREGNRVKLAKREIDVLAHAALGSTNAEIAQALGLQAGTVKGYLRSAAVKLRCSSRHATVIAARREGLIP